MQAARLPGVREVRGTLGEDLQTARLVAGQRAELDVLGRRRAHALLVPHHAVAAQVVLRASAGAAEPHQRQQRGGEHARAARAAQVCSPSSTGCHSLQCLRVVAAVGAATGPGC